MLICIDDPLPGNRTRLRASQRSATENRKRQGSSPVVETSTGPVQGNQLPDIQEFLGIPFAQPPVDQLRWAPSKQMERWNAIFQATEFGAACTQQSSYYAGDSKKCQGSTRGVCLGYSEDCLTLNIWTPSTTGQRAVMLWIHGGCYVSGSASDLEYNATSLAATTDVVVVSVQYRLGVFGFLGSPDMRSRDPQGSTGNYGLMDNIAALRWVQSNIAAFGGDPSRVTIFGESSGAGSVSLLMGVEESWPFYQQAIMESGTGSFWSYITLEGAQNNWQQVLAATKCSSDANSSSSSLITCILAASRSLLTDAVQQIPCRDGCTWAPVLDGVFLRGTPVQQAKQGLLRPNTPSISGFNRNDGAMFVTGYPVSMLTMSESSLDDYFSKRFGEERKATLQKLFPPSSAGGGGWTSQYFNAASACETDFSYSCTALWISTWSSPSFVYKFSEPDFEGLTLHGDEIPYIFGTLSSPSAQQTQLSSLMMQYWSNFAKGGDPNGPSLPPWPSWGGEVLLNISAEPVLVTVPNNSWPGCGFFLENWDFYSLCLPGTVQTQRSMIV